MGGGPRESPDGTRVHEGGRTRQGDVLREGQRAILKLGTEGRMYVVRIEEVREDALVLSAPICLGQVVCLEPGASVEVEYHRYGSMYGFQTTVQDFRPGHLPLITVMRPAEIRKVQRREHVRWPVLLPVVVAGPGGDGEVEGRAVDLSGGGLAANLPGEWEEGQEVRVRLYLHPDHLREVVEAMARVVRVWRPEIPGAEGACAARRGTPPRLRVAFEFTRIAPASREAIIRYIFARQREFLRAGLAGRDRGAG
ncbi:MAG: PilZ domain-containing protein [Bacillota bacterium]|nr:PilZ domain-containing protein [Bacillota bacterium]